ncbi:MAG: ATP-binding cassette domain-containing protein [Eubacterium sp.]
MEGTEAMIKLNNVSFSYDSKQVLKDLSLTINDGDRICLWGDSGVGKTTVLRLILGLEKAEANAVICTDKRFSAVFQENRLLPFKTIEENIMMLGGGDRLDYILDSLKISEAKNKYPSQLSGGMARRAAIARALSIDADVYIFDEPFTGLDRDNIGRAISLINEFTKGKTLICVMHDRETAELLNCKIINIEQINLLTE